MPTHWMELDKTSHDGASEKVLYDSVSVLVAREKLQKTEVDKISFKRHNYFASLDFCEQC